MNIARNRWITNGPVFHWAHRGAGFEGPPNTIWAMARALEAGANGLELDVHRTADNVLVVCHDPTVDDSTDATASSTAGSSTTLSEMTFEQVQTLDAGHWWSPGTLSNHDPRADTTLFPLRGQAGSDPTLRIPQLSEVIERFPGIPLNIDLKSPGYETDVAELLAATGADSRTIVASFGRSIHTFRQAAPRVATAANRRELINFGAQALAARQPKVPFVAAQIPLLPAPLLRRFVAGAHRCGVAVHVWTIDDRQVAGRLARLGVDGLMTNSSTMLGKLLTEIEAAWSPEMTREIDRFGALE